MMTPALAFTPEQTCALTGLTRSQLRYWAKTGFFDGEFDVGDATSLYSFRDVVGLRAISVLRRDHRVPLQELRRVGEWLASVHETPWASLTLYVSGRKVYFQDPETGRALAAGHPQQAHLPMNLKRVADDVARRVEEIRARKRHGKVEKSRTVARNAARIADTRVPTSAIWSFHRAGYDVAAIVHEYPTLNEADVLAAIEFERKAQKKTG